jgi:hypothetical protein
MLSVRRAGDGGSSATVREEGKEKSWIQEDCDLSGSSTLTVGCSGQVPLRREREKPSETDHHRGIDLRAGGRHEEQPSRRKGGDILLGYSGRTALRRKQCDVLPESQNVGAGVAKHISPTRFGPADKNRIDPISIQWKHLYNNGGMLSLHNGFARSVPITT